MMELMTNRVQEVCLNIGQKVYGDGLRPSPGYLKSTHFNRVQHERELTKKVRENSLYHLKEVSQKTFPIAAPSRPLMGLSCTQCIPNNRDTVIPAEKQNVINILAMCHENTRHRGFIYRYFCTLTHVYNLRKTVHKQLTEKVIKDDRLKEAVELVTQDTISRLNEKTTDSSSNKAKSEYSAVHKDIEKRAKMIVYNMKSTMSDFLLRLACWTLYRLLPYFLSSISISPVQMKMVKKAQSSGLPLIFLPLHKSHLDYLLVTFTLLNNDINAPLVAAGDNLKIPFFGWLLRGLGAFYIKRRLENNGSGEKDILYRAALHTYIMHCLKDRNNIEIFIEGGRTRTGKPLLPKGGILSVIIDAYLDKTIEDALLIPVSMNYDKIVEGNFIREQTGMPKQMETFTGAVKSIWKVLNSHYGTIRIDFNQPFSIRELVRTFQQYPNKLSPPISIQNSPDNSFNYMKNNNEPNGTISIEKLSKERRLTSQQSCSSLYGTDVVVEEQRGLIDAIARHIIYDCTSATAVMSTNAIGYILLTKYRNGCKLNELVNALSALRNELNIANRDVGFTGESEDVVNHAINLLGSDLVTKETISNQVIIKPVLSIPNTIELAYYSNCVLPHFVMQSIVATALQSLIVNVKDLINHQVNYGELLDVSLQLCEVMSQEFLLCKPCQTLDNLVAESISQLIYKGILNQVNETVNTFRTVEDDDFGFGMSRPYFPDYYVSMSKDATCIRHQLQTALRPLIETYDITTSCLSNILGETGMSEPDFVKTVVIKIRELVQNGECKYAEALSVDAIKNCVRLLRQWGVLEAHSKGKIRVLYVTSQYKNKDFLNKIYRLINKFKIELPKLPS